VLDPLPFLFPLIQWFSYDFDDGIRRIMRNEGTEAAFSDGLVTKIDPENTA
jgi:hypothetical protein